MKKILLAMVVVGLFIGFSVTPAPAKDVVDLAWDANQEADLAGYRLYWRFDGEAYDYTAKYVEIPKTETTWTLTDAAVGGWKEGDYYFVIRAFDTGGLFSVDSNECTTNMNLVPGAPGGLSCTKRPE